MSLKLNAPGGGSVTLQEPTTASNVTLNLPASNGTVVFENASGNVGIGVTPSAWGFGGNIEIGNGVVFAGAGPVVNYSANAFFDTAWKYKTTAAASYFRQANGAFNFFNAPSGTAGNAITFTQAMTLDASGNLLVGTTSASGDGISLLPRISGGSTTSQVVFNRTSTASAGVVLSFNNGGTQVGSVSHTNTATTYSTSSDYRLKENVQPMTGALAKVQALKPVTYKWKADGSDGEGFIAHELAEVVPQCVTGEKDAVDSEGNPQYQGIDTSFLVATLTAGLQEAVAMIEELKAKVAALEAK